MPLMSTLIAAACMNLPKVHNGACNHFIEAGTKHTQIYQNEEKLENYTLNIVRQRAEGALGPVPVAAVGGAGYAYKVYKAKTLNFKLPTLGMASGIDAHVGLATYGATIRWNF